MKRYVNDFAARQNLGERNTIAIMTELAARMIDRRLTGAPRHDCLLPSPGEGKKMPRGSGKDAYRQAGKAHPEPTAEVLRTASKAKALTILSLAR